MTDEFFGKLILIIALLLPIGLVYMANGFFLYSMSMRRNSETDLDRSRKYMRIGAMCAIIFFSSILLLSAIDSVMEGKNISLGEWMPNIYFLAGTAALIFYAKKKNLYRFRGGKYRTRITYFLSIGILLMTYFSWKQIIDIYVLLKASVLSIILSVSFYMYARKWIEKHLDGTTIVYEKKLSLHSSSVLILSVFLTVFIFGYATKGFNAKWLIGMLTFYFSWTITSLRVLFYVINLEKKLGVSILEDEK